MFVAVVVMVVEPLSECSGTVVNTTDDDDDGLIVDDEIREEDSLEFEIALHHHFRTSNNSALQ